jgi:Tfp pilus assembly protein PilN
MPIINLIQEQQQARERMDQRSRIAFLALIGTGVLAVFGLGILHFQAVGLKTEIGRLDSELTKMKPIIAEIEEDEKDQAVLQPQLKTLEDAQNQTNKWTHILQYLRTETPSDSWLTGVAATSSTQPDKPTLVVIQGTARGQQPISEFILRAENEPDLQNVALHFTQEKKSANGKAIDFEMGAELAGSVDQKKSVKEDQKS